MQHRKFILLSAIVPIIVVNIMLLVWLLSSASILVWVGFFVCPLMFLLTLIGSLQFFSQYRKQNAKKQEPKRFLVLAGYVLILGLGLTFSYHGFNLFKREVVRSASKQADVIVNITNTSMEKAKGIKVQLGEQIQEVDEIAPREEKNLTFSVGEETLLKVQLGKKSEVRETQVQVNKQVGHIYLRLDPQQNIMVELN